MARNRSLIWPEGWPRTAAERQTPLISGVKKELALPAAVRRLQREISWLGAVDVLVSLEAEPRKARRAAGVVDPGAAVYFRLGQQTYVLACDRWQRQVENVFALGRHIRSIAASLEHFGVGSVAQAFAGYVGDPPPAATPRERGWRAVLQVPPGMPVTVQLINSLYRNLAKRLHPDQPNGSHAAMTELNLARAEALRSLAR